MTQQARQALPSLAGPWNGLLSSSDQLISPAGATWCRVGRSYWSSSSPWSLRWHRRHLSHVPWLARLVVGGSVARLQLARATAATGRGVRVHAASPVGPSFTLKSMGHNSVEDHGCAGCGHLIEESREFSRRVRSRGLPARASLDTMTLPRSACVARVPRASIGLLPSPHEVRGSARPGPRHEPRRSMTTIIPVFQENGSTNKVIPAGSATGIRSSAAYGQACDLPLPDLRPRLFAGIRRRRGGTVQQPVVAPQTAGHRDRLQSRRLRSLSAFAMTETEDRAMAAAAMMGESSNPNTG